MRGSVRACVCVRVGARSFVRARVSGYAVCVWVRARVCVFVCVFVCVRACFGP